MVKNICTKRQPGARFGVVRQSWAGAVRQLAARLGQRISAGRAGVAGIAMVASSHILAANGNINQIIGGIAPNWGPFGALGAKAKTLIDVVLAVGAVICAITAMIGFTQLRVAAADRNPVASSHGRALVVGGCLGLFLLASSATIFTIIYGFGV